jgi:hypothetical protein
VGVGVGVGVGSGMHASKTSALATEETPSKPPAAMILLLLLMNAPDVNERSTFMFAEVLQVSVTGLYTKVLLVVLGMWALFPKAAALKVLAKAALVEL